MSNHLFVLFQIVFLFCYFDYLILNSSCHITLQKHEIYAQHCNIIIITRHCSVTNNFIQQDFVALHSFCSQDLCMFIFVNIIHYNQIYLLFYAGHPVLNIFFSLQLCLVVGFCKKQKVAVKINSSNTTLKENHFKISIYILKSKLIFQFFT